MIMNKILFTADLHFGHTNILKHQPNRPFAQEGDNKAHDEYMLDLWKSSVGKRDLVYILGDLTFFKSEDARHLLEKLPGQKFLLQGNHDGSIMLHGHCHGKLDEYNRLSNDLRFDVGIDGELAKRAGGLVPLELIYETAMAKTGGVPFHQYAKKNYRSEVR